MNLNENNGHFSVLSLDLSRVFGVMDTACFLCFSLPSWHLGTHHCLDSFLFPRLSLLSFSHEVLYAFSSHIFFSALTPFRLLCLYTSYLSPPLDGFRLHRFPETPTRYLLNPRLTNRNFTCRVSGTFSQRAFWKPHYLPLQVCFSYITLHVISTDIKLFYSGQV